MRIGIVSTSLGDVSLAETFKLAREAGAEGIEVMYGSDGLRDLTASDHAEQLKALATGAKLEIPSLCLGFLLNKPSLLGTDKELTTARKAIRTAISVAAEVGVKTVLVPLFGNSSIELEEEIGHVVDAAGELVADAEEADVVLGFESNLSFNRQRFLLDSFGSPARIKVYQDTGNARARKLDLATGLRDLGGEALAGIHFKDVQVREGHPPNYDITMCDGDVDFRAVVQSLRAIGYNGWVVLETPPGSDPVDNAKNNIERARSLVQE